MTRADFEASVFMQLRQIIPELPSWEEATRYLRVVGESVDSFDQLGSYKPLYELMVAEAFRRYGDLSWNCYLDEEVQTDKPMIAIESYNVAPDTTHVYDPERVWNQDLGIWLDRDETPGPETAETGPPERYSVLGGAIRFYPKPDKIYKIRFVGRGYPYFQPVNSSDPKTDLLIGVRPGTEYQLARYVFSYLIDQINLNLANAIRQEIEAIWLMDRQRNAWNQLKDSRGNRYVRNPWSYRRRPFWG